MPVSINVVVLKTACLLCMLSCNHKHVSRIVMLINDRWLSMNDVIFIQFNSSLVCD